MTTVQKNRTTSALPGVRPRQRAKEAQAERPESVNSLLSTREKRLWEQLRAYDWSRRGRTSYIRTRQIAVAFEKKMAGILTEQGEPSLAKDALHAAQVYHSRAALARGDRAIRLTLLRLWVQTVCEQHHWPLPTFEPTKPPPASSEPTGSGSSDGTQGQPGTVFVIELDSPAGTTPEGAPDTTSTSVPEDLGATWLEVFEPQALAPEALEPQAPAAAIEPQVLPAPTPSTAKQPPFGCGVRQARVVIQWFPVVVAGMAVIMTGCQHAPVVPDVTTPPAVQLPPSSLELIEQPFLAFDCERLALECPPPTVSRRILSKMKTYCRHEGISIDHCQW